MPGGVADLRSLAAHGLRGVLGGARGLRAPPAGGNLAFAASGHCKLTIAICVEIDPATTPSAIESRRRLSAARSSQGFDRMRVSKLMAKDVITCRTDDTIDGAAELMWTHDIGSLPVVDEQGRVVGILTDRDALMAAFTCKEPLRAISVGSTMSTLPFTCSQDDDVAAVEAEMGRRQIRRVPVLDDDGRPVGLLSMNDLARAAQRSTEISPAEVAATLAAVCAPRRIGVAP